METVPTSKRCTGPCGAVKPLGKFDDQKAGKYGKTAKCKACRHEADAIRASADTGSSPKDKFFAALERDRRARGVHYSTMTDAWRILTGVMGYKEPS